MPFMNIVLIVVERFLQHRMLGKFHDQQGDVELDMFPDKAAETLSIPHFSVQLPEGVIRCASRLIECLWGQVVQLGTQDT